jgi:hypothetical protein
MHFITFVKSTGEIVDYRSDTSVPAYWTEGSLKAAVSKDKNLPESSIETLSFPNRPNLDDGISNTINLHEHAFDVAANKVKNNPNYVAPPLERRWGLNDVMSCLTLSEKTKFINNLTPTVVTAKEEFKQPRNQSDTTEVLQFLVDSGDISSDSMAKILS